MSATSPAPPVEWSDAEHEEIMSLHIREGLTIADAQRRVLAARSSVAEKR
jgi:hypothetical protein